MHELPETILQFGSGKFLRGFADLFIHQANAWGQGVGRVVVVQTTGDARANLLRAQGGRYHVAVRGLADGKVVDEIQESASISRALIASQEWPEVLAVARSPALRIILSNTAEAGYDLDSSDRPDSAPPRSFPAKLLLVLRERCQAGLPGVTVLPCELFEGNADKLQGIVLGLAEAWQMPGALGDWLKKGCLWRNALVDRIVCSHPADIPQLRGDPLAVAAEPYALWAIEVKQGPAGLFRHPAIKITPDVRPFFLRKVRILNAAHTALLSRAIPKGYATVRDAVLDPEIEAWLHRLLFEEIVPVLRGRVEEPEQFARQTLERFLNPFLVHKLCDIAVYHEAKVKIRLVPTRAEYLEQFGKAPACLDEAIAWQGPKKS
jgi:tagaturonate reductase